MGRSGKYCIKQCEQDSERQVFCVLFPVEMSVWIPVDMSVSVDYKLQGDHRKEQSVGGVGRQSSTWQQSRKEAAGVEKS